MVIYGEPPFGMNWATNDTAPCGDEYVRVTKAPETIEEEITGTEGTFAVFTD